MANHNTIQAYLKTIGSATDKAFTYSLNKDNTVTIYKNLTVMYTDTYNNVLIYLQGVLMGLLLAK
jgi:hypothetical protein